MITVIILFLLILTGSALCSMAEAAVLSLPFTRARILYEQGHAAARDLMVVKEDLAVAISSLVIINNAINIAGAMFIGRMVAGIFGDKWLGLISAVLTTSIIVIGEIFPKTVGERFKIPLSLFFARPLRAVMWVFGPLVRAIVRATGLLSRHQQFQRVTEDEIKIMLKLGRDAGTVEVDEEVLCNRVFKLNDVRARQIMKPLGLVYSLRADDLLDSAKDMVVRSPYSRIAVYGTDPSDVVGVVQRNVLLRHIVEGRGASRIREFMIKPVYVADTTRADTLLSMFQKYHQHLFIVQDNCSNDIGIVTMEDVLEELFGEIYDEKDMETHALRYPRK